jgi:hypothetical protein
LTSNEISRVKKEHSSKDKKIVITKTNNNCTFLLYYDNGIIKKSKIFVYPRATSGIKKVNKSLNQEYKLWLRCLWHYGFLEEDDTQLIEFKKLDKKSK